MRKHSVREVKFPFHLEKTVNVMMYYSLSLFLIFYRSSGKVKHKKIIRLRNDRNITESSWLHAYGTTPTKHLHLVCLFNYLVLVIFLIVWPFSFIRWHIDSGSHFSFLWSFRIFMFKCIHSFVLDNIPFQTLW